MVRPWPEFERFPSRKATRDYLRGRELDAED